MAKITSFRQVLVSALLVLSVVPTMGSSKPLASAQTSSDIAIRMTANLATVRPGQQITYTVTMTNLGPGDATSVDTYFQLPDQLVMINMACDKGISPDTPACEYGPLAVGSSVVSTLVARPKPSRMGHSKSVTASAAVFFEEESEFDPNLANNMVSITTPVTGHVSHP
jgi:uncharacterized repeat protein (TIGR01451 family)